MRQGNNVQHQRIFEKLNAEEAAWAVGRKKTQMHWRYISYSIHDPYQRRSLNDQLTLPQMLQSGYLQPVILYGLAMLLLVSFCYVDAEKDWLSQLILPLVAAGATLYLLLHCLHIKQVYFRIDAAGIRTGADQIAWKDIEAVFLVTHRQNLSLQNYLVLFLPDMTEVRYRYFQEYVPRNFTRTLAAAIRTYRPER